MYQTVLIVMWIAWNVVAPDSLQFDPYDRGLVLLTLVLSLQAAYAAPADPAGPEPPGEPRPRPGRARPRHHARTQADTEFLARELASVRLALSDVVTNEDLDERLGQLTKAVEHLSERLEQVALPPARPADHVVHRRSQCVCELVGLAPADEVVAGDIDHSGTQRRGEGPLLHRPDHGVLGGDQHPGRSIVEGAKPRASKCRSARPACDERRRVAPAGLGRQPGDPGRRSGLRRSSRSKERQTTRFQRRDRNMPSNRRASATGSVRRPS